MIIASENAFYRIPCPFLYQKFKKNEVAYVCFYVFISYWRHHLFFT